MTRSDSESERLVLDIIKTQPSVTMERLVTLLPQMTWNRVFQAIDTLSRRGEITIRRRGFDYELVLALSSHVFVPGWGSGDPTRSRSAR